MINQDIVKSRTGIVSALIAKPGKSSDIKLMNFKIEGELKDRFIDKCRRSGSDASTVLREYIIEYLNK